MNKLILILVLGFTGLKLFAGAPGNDPSATVSNCPQGESCEAAQREPADTISDQAPSNRQYKSASGAPSNNCCGKNVVDPDRDGNTNSLPGEGTTSLPPNDGTGTNTQQSR
jgi:hypothetical protein